MGLTHLFCPVLSGQSQKPLRNQGLFIWGYLEGEVSCAR
jgi:hypothetical protein